jgi:hypothetical protein
MSAGPALVAALPWLKEVDALPPRGLHEFEDCLESLRPDLQVSSFDMADH